MIGRSCQQLLRDGCGQLGIEITEEGYARLELYYTELRRWSERINLIAKKQSQLQIIEKHFLDSLTLLTYLNDDGSLADVGTGAGFPGLVCKSVMPGLRLTLIEPRFKRVSFLRHMVRILQLHDVEIIADRVEKKPLAAFSCSSITSRAVTGIGEFLHLVQHLMGENTRIICMKGPQWKEEISDAASSLKLFNLELTQLFEYTLPFSGAQRALLCFNKTSCQQCWPDEQKLSKQGKHIQKE